VQGAQAIEVIPWVEEDKARQAEWVQVSRGGTAGGQGTAEGTAGQKQ